MFDDHSRSRRWSRVLTKTLAASVAVASVIAVAGCGEEAREAAKAKTNEIVLWTHSAGFDDQAAAVQKMVDDYNAQPDKKATVKIQAFPQASYGDSVTSAASAGKLPCLVDVDQPNVPYWASTNILAPFTDKALLERTDELLDSAVGRYDDKIYAAGWTNDTTGLFARKSVLEALGIRIATVDEPWSREEFMDALEKMKEAGKNPVTGKEWKYPLEMGTADTTGEWYSYAFSPLLQSFGGDLIDRDGLASADGKLNGKAAVEFGKWMRSLVENGYMPVKGEKDTSLALVNDEIGLLYGGEWAYNTLRQYDVEASDIAMMPAPDLGQGSVAGGGAWEVGVTTSCSAPEAAQDYIRFALQDKYILDIAGGSIPATETARQQSEKYKDGGEMQIFADISNKYVRMRPETPAYNFISTEFRTAVADIMSGADPQQTLDKAVEAIDANIKSTGAASKGADK